MCHEACGCNNKANEGVVYLPTSIDKTDPDPVTALFEWLDIELERAKRAQGEL